MRTGEVQIISAAQENMDRNGWVPLYGAEVPYGRIVEAIELANRHPFESGLIMRKCSASRVPIALATGSDRTRSASVNKYGPIRGDGSFEREAMREFGFGERFEDVTYDSYLSPDDVAHRVKFGRDETIVAGRALLVYAPEALQAIAPSSDDTDRLVEPIGFKAFIDPRLKEVSLLAVAYSF